jgi:hypothetical protein
MGAGFCTVVEGIFYSEHYGDMLLRPPQDHSSIRDLAELRYLRLCLPGAAFMVSLRSLGPQARCFDQVPPHEEGLPLQRCFRPITLGCEGLAGRGAERERFDRRRHDRGVVSGRRSAAPKSRADLACGGQPRECLGLGLAGALVG